MSYVAGMSAEELRHRFNVERVVKLGSNENPLGPSPAAKQALLAELDQLNRYPGTEEEALVEAIAARTGVGAGEVALGNGSVELLVSAVRELCGGKSSVVIPRPHFMMYEIAANWCGVPIEWVEARDLAYDLEALAEAACTRGVGLVFLTNPNNPTGLMVSSDELRDFFARVPEDVVVVLDEAYGEYATDPRFPDAVRYVREGRRVIVTRTFSKIYGLAGLRVGYAIGRADLVASLKRQQAPFHIGRQALAAALAAFDDHAFLELSRTTNRDGAAYLATELARLGIHTLPTQANHILLTGLRHVGELDLALQQRGVIVRPTEPSFGVPDCIRITIGTAEDNRAVVEAFREALAAVSAAHPEPV